MNSNQVKSAVRWVLTLAFGSTVGAAAIRWVGISPADIPVAVDYISGLAGIGALAWAQHHHAKTT